MHNYLEEISAKKTTQAQNQNLNYLINPSFQGLNRLFVLPFENNAVRTEHTNFVRPSEGIKGRDVISSASKK